MKIRPRRLLIVPLMALLAGTVLAEQQVSLLGYTASVPDHWVAETPKSEMRKLQFKVPASAGDGAELIVYYFGPGQGGTLEANIERWQSQFQGPDGAAVTPIVTAIGSEAIPATLVELSGRYGRSVGMGPSDAVLEDRMLLAGIIETPEGNLFPQMHGPAELVAAQREGFIAFVRSLSPAAAATP